jgi:hypothetical protein
VLGIAADDIARRPGDDLDLVSNPHNDHENLVSRYQIKGRVWVVVDG